MENATESRSLTAVAWVYHSWSFIVCTCHREEDTKAALNLAKLKQCLHTIAFPVLTTEGNIGTKSYFAEGTGRLKQGSVV